ncbi:MAG: hypothetical protein GWO38_00145 [Phycisphaerae bacterium]|nr:hypothetical protein [Phycisphaerae bacterium]NIX26059.1 hypothetical protein [Phycisphaerae bacterium]
MIVQGGVSFPTADDIVHIDRQNDFPVAPYPGVDCWNDLRPRRTAQAAVK